MIKRAMKQLFNDYEAVSKNLRLNLNLRPQNLSLDTYYKLAYEYEKLNN